MYEKEFPSEPTDTTAGDPCILVDGYFFIWTSTMFMFAGARGRRSKMKKEETKDRGRPKMKIKAKNLEDGKGTNLMKISH
jgi:hypothetical protein